MSIWIGTSGFHYKHWSGTYYPPGTPSTKMFELYRRDFNTVELNTTFYHLPKLEAVERWRASTPPGFRFAAKGSRFITHMKKLKDPEQALERYFDALAPLGTRLGPVLWQLPPNWNVDLDRLRYFLGCLPPEHPHAFEFRNQSWNRSAVYELLRSRNAAYCIFDLAGYRSPLEVTSSTVYVRLHGPGAKNQGSYSDAALREWANLALEWERQERTIYFYFDNDQAGYAPANALRLCELCNTRPASQVDLECPPSQSVLSFR